MGTAGAAVHPIMLSSVLMVHGPTSQLDLMAGFIKWSCALPGENEISGILLLRVVMVRNDSCI